MYLPENIAKAVQQNFDAKLVAARLRTEIEDRFQQDKSKAIAPGQHWDALRELEKQHGYRLVQKGGHKMAAPCQNNVD